MKIARKGVRTDTFLSVSQLEQHEESPTRSESNQPILKFAKRHHIGGVFVAIILSTLPFADGLFGKRTLMYGDVLEQNVPYFRWVWQQLLAGESPIWTPKLFGGFSAIGSGQFAIFYPPNVLFALKDAVLAHRLWILVHLWLGVVAMFTYAYKRFAGVPGAIVAAVGFSLSGYHVFHLIHVGLFAAYSWVPVMLIGIDLLAEKWSFKRSLLAVVPVSMIALIGHPQSLWIVCFGGAIYAIGTVTLARRADRFKATARVAIAMVIGLFLAAIALLPLWKFSRGSSRSTYTRADAFEFSLAPRHLWNFLFPYAYGGATGGAEFSAPWKAGLPQIQEYTPYAGITILLLALFAIWIHWRDRFVRTLAALSLVSALYSLGGSTPFGMLVYQLPIASGFRAWARNTQLIHLALSSLSALGVRTVLERPRQAARWFAAMAGAVSTGAFIFARMDSLTQFRTDGSFFVLARLFPIVLVLGLLLAALFRQTSFGSNSVADPNAISLLDLREGSVWAGVALVSVCALDMMSFARVAPWNGTVESAERAKEFFMTDPPPFGMPFNASGGIDRWAADTYSYASVSLIKNIQGINAFDPLMQKDWSKVAGGLAYYGQPTRDDFWSGNWFNDIMRVTTLSLRDDLTPKGDGWALDYPIVGWRSNRWIRTPVLAEAYLVDQVIVRKLDQIQSAINDPKAPFRIAAFTETPVAMNAPIFHTVQEDNVAPSPGTVISSDLRKNPRAKIDASRDSFLVLSTSWSAGWTARIDGRAAPVYRTNGIVMGVAVPAGKHDVRLVFDPPGFATGKLISTTTAFSFLVSPLLAGRFRTWRRRSQRPST
jgi:Bacterial membrane protein YfhO